VIFFQDTDFELLVNILLFLSVQKYADAGVLTSKQGEQMKQNIDNATKYQEQNGTVAPGLGCGGGGNGMMGGYGGGYGMMGSYNNSGYYSNDSGTVGNAGQTI